MRKRNKERLKSAILVSLFVLSLGLNTHVGLNFLDNKLVNKFNKTNIQKIEIEKTVTENIVRMISPQRYIVNFGGGLHTIIYSDSYDIWTNLTKSFIDSYHEQNVEVIDYDRWKNAVEHKSLLLEFKYSISPKNLLDILGKQLKLKDSMAFNKILICQKDNNVYLGNDKDNIYFVVKDLNNIYNILKKIDKIENTDYQTYYNIKDIYGIQNKNLIPEAFQNISKVQVEKEIMPTNERATEAFAETFFGNNLDFIRRIKETSGTIVYMYGYGQRVLRIEESGRIEYVEEINPRLAAEKSTIDISLKLAANFISTHGNTPLNKMYLRNIIPFIDGGKQGYKFLFGYKLNNLPVYKSSHSNSLNSMEPIEVKILGKQIISYKRNVKSQKNVANFLEESKDILKARQVIDLNFETIKNDYVTTMISQGALINEQTLSSDILKSLQNVQIGYYDNEKIYKNEVIPIWIIKDKVKTYYIDAYTGEILESM